MTINPGSGASPCWADISSAPRDKIILIAFTICRDPEPQVRESKWSEQDGSFVSVNRFLIYDTAFAWMPMPDPPNAKDQTAGASDASQAP
jgi:hypothetical protein